MLRSYIPSSSRLNGVRGALLSSTMLIGWQIGDVRLVIGYRAMLAERHGVPFATERQAVWTIAAALRRGAGVRHG